MFTKVTEAKIGIKGNEELKIFKLNVGDNEFTYEGLRKLLNANIGRYVFSRLTMEQYKNNDVLESVGGDAAQYIREHASGNELGEMLIYAFLEEMLNAPKLMNAIELGSADNRSAVINLYNLPGQKNNFQLVYGASNIKGDIKTAIDNAFISVTSLKSNRITGSELVNNASYSRCINSAMAEQVRSIVYPSKNTASVNMLGTSFGVFIGYSIGLDPEYYTIDEYADVLNRKLESDINDHSSYIYKKIRELKIGNHLFYAYILHFNYADSDKNTIISSLIVGATK